MKRRRESVLASFCFSFRINENRVQNPPIGDSKIMSLRLMHVLK